MFLVSNEIIRNTIITNATIASIDEDFFISLPDNRFIFKNSLLNRHSKFAQTYMYCPLKDFLTEDVWNFLLQNKNPWGENNRDLLTMYQEANASECPLVVDTTTPSCGGGRFGCWTCTVVARDKSMDSLLEGGEDWLEPLAEIREELKRTQEHEVKLLVRGLFCAM